MRRPRGKIRRVLVVPVVLKESVRNVLDSSRLTANCMNPPIDEPLGGLYSQVRLPNPLGLACVPVARVDQNDVARLDDIAAARLQVLGGVPVIDITLVEIKAHRLPDQAGDINLL